MTPRPLITLPVLAAVGCGTGAGERPRAVLAPKIPVAMLEEGKESRVMPLAKGNSWTYSYEQVTREANGRQSSDQRELTWTVVRTDLVPGGIRAIIQVSSGGSVADRQVWRCDATGLFQERISNKDIPYTPALPVMRFPLAKYGAFKWSGRGVLPVGQPGPMTVDIQVLGPQEVDTDLKRISAIAIESRSRFAAEKFQGVAANTMWFSPGVGLVRYRSEVAIGNVIGVTVIKLKSTNLKIS